MEYTLADAAKVARVNKSTLFRAIKSGRLSGRRLDDGSFRVDASELARVYDLEHMTRGGNDALHHGAPDAATTAIPSASETELAVLRVKVEMLEDQLAREREAMERERGTIRLIESQLGRERDDLRKLLDEEREERRALQRQLIPLVVPPQAKPQDGRGETPGGGTAAKPAKGFLGRFLGR